jgi:hypothetical protein
VTSSPQDPHAQESCARTRRSARVAALAAAGVAVFGSSSAQAVDCADIPNAILGIGGSAPNALVQAVSKKFAADPTAPITVVYSSPGACRAMDALVPGSNGAVKTFSELNAGTGEYYDAQGNKQTCTYPAGATTVADWGSMAQEAGTCSVGGAAVALPATVGDYIGPISGFSLIAPLDSSENAISAEAIYYIYGLGITPQRAVSPWTDPASIATRGNTSAAGLLLAKAAGIPLRPLGYKDVSTNQGAVDHVVATQDHNKALGFCSTETVEAQQNVTRVKTLAYKQTGQDYAYYPNSASNTFDKKNLREGRYFLWNPHHFFALKSKLTPNSPLQRFINVITSVEEIPGNQSFLDLQIAVGNVPKCAMQVDRQGDMGPLVSFQPEHGCGCYYDFKTTGTTSCKQCSASNPCGAGFECNHGYCEVTK